MLDFGVKPGLVETEFFNYNVYNTKVLTNVSPHTRLNGTVMFSMRPK